jgi:hypothetical protein
VPHDTPPRRTVSQWILQQSPKVRMFKAEQDLLCFSRAGVTSIHSEYSYIWSDDVVSPSATTVFRQPVGCKLVTASQTITYYRNKLVATINLIFFEDTQCTPQYLSSHEVRTGGAPPVLTDVSSCKIIVLDWSGTWSSRFLAHTLTWLTFCRFVFCGGDTC